jgi:ABC-type polysaccharide/polyol phosphate transport system ATPase subunit
MSDLTIELDRPLPELLRVGRANALRVAGTVRCRKPIDELSLLVGERVHPVTDLAPAGRHSKRRGWSAVIPFGPVERREVDSVRARARLADGAEAEVQVGEIILTPDLEAGLGGPGLVRSRKALAAAAGGSPLVAIAMATHEPDPGLFERQVESIRAQGHHDWVCVISDDSSAARTLDRMRAVVGDDRRFMLIPSGPRRGMYRNFERALLATPGTAEYVALCDQADRWYPEKLETLLDSFEPGVELAYAGLRVLGPADGHDGERPVTAAAGGGEPGVADLGSLLASSAVPGSGSLFRRQVVDLALPFPEPDPELRHDRWLALVALALGEARRAPAPLSDRFESRHRRGSDPRPTGLAAGAAATLRLRCEERLDDAGLERLDEALRVAEERPGEDAEPRSLGGRLRRAGRRRRERSTPVAEPRATGALAAAAALAADGGGRRPSPRARSATNGASERAPVPADAPPAILVEGVRKSFRIPTHRPDGLIDAIRHPLARAKHDRFDALSEISFEVRQGEFFGIVGRNGSGKSTLLQILSNVYRPDEGTVLIAPRVAPIISLGIGFQPELAALENVVLTAELLGVPPEESRRRFDEVIEFAELEEFVDLKLKNYSSGMRVRLAFATVLLVDADVLLLDEILAVGDQAFREKAARAFNELLADKTVVLVTHHMSYLQRFCDRAMLLEDGKVELIGAPDEVAGRYAELALEGHGVDVMSPRGDPKRRRPREKRAEITDLTLAGSTGERMATVAPGEEIVLRVAVEASAPIQQPGLRLEIRNEGNSRIFGRTLELERGAHRLRRGERVELETAIENRLTAGSYAVVCTVVARPRGAERAVSGARTARFLIEAGETETAGMVDLKHSVRIAERTGGPRARRRRRGGRPR